MRERLGKLLASAAGGGAMCLILFAVFAAVALLSGNLMTLLGFRYASTGHLLLYFLAAEVISLPLDLFCQGLPRALYELGKVRKWEANLLYVPLEAMCTVFSFWLVDRFMDSVSATGISLWAMALIMALLSQPVKKARKEKH